VPRPLNTELGGTGRNDGISSSFTYFTQTGSTIERTVSAKLGEFISVKDFGAVGDGSTDDSTAITNAIKACTDDGTLTGTCVKALRVPAGVYVTGAQLLPAAFRMIGDGRLITTFLCKAGTTGAWFTDNGNAAKFNIEGVAFYCNSETGLTYGLRLGYNTTQFGTEGHLSDIWVRDLNGASALWGFDINGNVGFMDTITVWSCANNIRITGVANHASNLVSYAPVTTGADLNLVDVDGLEIEAPGNSCVPLYIRGNASVDGLIISLANSTTISHLVEFNANATTWSITSFNLAFGSTPAGVTVSNGNYKRSDGSYFGGNATAGSRNGEGNYSSDFAGQRPQCFTLSITNTAGTLQHKITEPGVNVATNWAGLINGASSSLTNTPTGADGSTAMAAGGKIGSASTNVFWLDTAAQKAADSQFSASIQFNSTGTALTVTPGIVSLNINGTTRARLSFQFNNAASGAAFGLTTANIAAGTFIQVLFNGRLS